MYRMCDSGHQVPYHHLPMMGLPSPAVLRRAALAVALAGGTGHLLVDCTENRLCIETEGE